MLDAERSEILEQLARARWGSGLDPAAGESASVRVSVAAAAEAEAFRRSPACGDQIRVRVRVEAGRLVAVRWDHRGCTVSAASASALASRVAASPEPPAAFARLAEEFVASLAPGSASLDSPELAVFGGIGRFPLRAGCASLAWRAALDALHDLGNPDPRSGQEGV